MFIFLMTSLLSTTNLVGAARGVAIDKDYDKVPDCLDKEPNSLIGAPVDEDGVALHDDKDGIPNLYDREDRTPLNCKVDKFGVAADGDRDGVPDCLDA